VAQDSSNQFGKRNFKGLGACAAALVATLVADVASAEQSGLGSAGARGARWKQSTVAVSVEDSVNLLGGEGEAFDAVVRAATAWQNAPGILPTLVVQHGPSDPIGYRRNGKNRNTVHFAPDGDPLANGALAITVITFDAHAKEILDADVVLNGEHGFSFFEHDARNEGMSTYDLQNVLTHELGHLLGLGEDMTDTDATMYAFSQPGETGKRDLEVVDKDSIAALYDEEFEAEMQGGCGGAAIAGYEGEAWVWAALGFGALGFAMRRRATRSAALSLTALSALVVFVGASNPSPSVNDGVAFLGADGSVPMTVQSSDSAWENGVIVTRLGLRGTDGANVTHEVTVKTLGGQVGELVQVVGHVLPPQIGDSLRIRLGTGVKGETIWVAPQSDRH
jgi:Matrixin